MAGSFRFNHACLYELTPLGYQPEARFLAARPSVCNLCVHRAEVEDAASGRRPHGVRLRHVQAGDRKDFGWRGRLTLSDAGRQSQ